MTIKKLAIALSLCAGMGLGAAASATTPIPMQDWTISGNAFQPDGTEWLRLTTSHRYMMGAIQSTKTYSPTQILKVEFDYVSWGGQPGGDGISLYLFDANAANAGTGGKGGGGLGYCGLAGAYVGIGLDEVGVFSSTWCENGRMERFATPNGISIRGSQESGYAFLSHFPHSPSLDCEYATCRTLQQTLDAGSLQRVVAHLAPKKSGSGYTINMSINGAVKLKNFDYSHPAPALMKLGIAGATGDYTNNHEIRNLQVTATDEECL